MDTAQLSGAAETDPNALLQNAADAFKAFDNPAPAQQRDEQGRFASEQPDEETEDDELEDAQAAEGEAATEDDDEDSEEAAEEAQPMPSSWPADKAEQWAQLPADMQALVAEREAERDRAVNAKFQESANARKAYEARQAEVNAKFDDFARAVETVEGLYRAPEPDPRAFGYGTAQFNEAAYVAAHQQWRQNEGVLAQLTEQRDAAAKERDEAEKRAFAEWMEEHEGQFRPKLFELAPDLKDPAKAPVMLQGLVKYAIDSGIPAETFEGEAARDITSAQLAILYKAQEFDRLKAANTAPKPKPAGPAVKPGVSSPRSAQKAARKQKDFDRLAREGSIEAGAAVFKHFLK